MNDANDARGARPGVSRRNFLGGGLVAAAVTPLLTGQAEAVVDGPHRYLQAQADAGLLDGRTVACVLTHDPKFELPLLTTALRMPLAYVGAMGSRRTHDNRLARLRDAGVTDHELDRLHSPIGLDLGARTPQEMALSIAAEIVAHRHGGSGVPLSTGVPIHHSAPLSGVVNNAGITIAGPLGEMTMCGSVLVEKEG